MLDRRGLRLLFLGALPVCLLWGENEPAQASHILFGDIRIEEAPSATSMAHTFVVTLKASTGRIFGRDTVPPNGRFRFNNVPNGDYELIIELGNRQIYAERLQIFEFKPSEVRHDLDFQWTEPTDEFPVGGPLQVVYARTAAALERWDEAQTLLSQGDHGGAAVLLRRIVESDPNDFEAWTELGTASFLRGRQSEAADAYQEALARRPDFLPALVNLGKLHLDGREYPEAVALLEKAVALAPERAETHRLLGEGYLGDRRGSKATVSLNQAIALDPEGMAEVHLRLAQLYVAAGYPALAVEEYEAFLRKRPESSLGDQLRAYIAEYR